jgi:murein DD-endopeptidase MepM/ murein hydrolase activator NlpD
MAISPSISFKKISDSVSSTKRQTKETKNTAINLSKLLNKNISTKRNLSSNIRSIKQKRIERENRNVLRDRLAAPLIAVKPKGPRLLAASDRSTSITDRLLGFVGYLSAGWILSNLPTWISLGEQFSQRIVAAGSILSGYGDELVEVISSIGNVFSAGLVNISKFDFSDSSYLVRSSLNDLKLSIDELGGGISDAFAVLIQPFKELEKIPDAFGQLPSTIPGIPGTPPSAQPSVSGSKLKPIHKQALDIISGPESGGDYNAINNGQSGDRPGGSKKWLGKNLTDMTIGEVKNYQNVKKTLWAAGRYQIVPGTLPSAQSAAGLKDTDMFDQNNQDLLAIGILKTQGPSAWTKYSKYSRKEIEIMYRAKDTPLGKSTATPTSQTPSPAQVLSQFGSPAAALLALLTGGAAGQRRLREGDVFTKSLGRGVDYIEVSSLVGDGRGHGGIDIAAPTGTYISLRVDCEVVAQGTYGDYGLLIDVWVPSLGIQLRMAHLSSVIIKSGKIPAGTSFARVGKSGRVTGPHIHLEYDTKKGSRGGGAINDDPNYAAKLDQYVRLLFLTNKPIGKGFAQPSQPLVSMRPAGASIATQTAAEVDMEGQSYLAGVLEGVKQERTGRKVIVIDDRQPATQQVVAASGGSLDLDLSTDESFLVNNFMKNKLLSDLSYV